MGCNTALAGIPRFPGRFIRIGADQRVYYDAYEMEIYDQVADFIDRHGLPGPPNRVVLGVSGGPDSVCLLDCMAHLGFDIILGHVDHQLREESPQEAEFVESLARDYGVPFESVKVNLREERWAERGLEEAARLARYQFLADTALKHDTRFAATGHTLDDQVETVLMNLLRGAGVRGLRGMQPATRLDRWTDLPGLRDPVELIRPQLAIPRSTTVKHCFQLGIVPIDDPSNRDPRFLRNRIRHELIPLLEEFNPAVKDAVWRTAGILGPVDDLLDYLIEEVRGSLVEPRGEGVLALRIPAFRDLPLALQRRLLRGVLIELTGHQVDVNFDSLEGLRSTILGVDQDRITTLGSLDAIRMGELFVLKKPAARIRFPGFPQLKPEGEYPLDLEVDGDAILEGDWRLRIEEGEFSQGVPRDVQKRDLNLEEVVDGDSIHFPLMIRPPKPGDRISSLGMEGSMKLSDLFINQGIPWPAREWWPLIVDRSGVVWVCGLRFADRVKLTESTQRVLLFTIEPGERGE